MQKPKSHMLVGETNTDAVRRSALSFKQSYKTRCCHSFDKNLLSTYFAQGNVLGSGHTAVKKRSSHSNREDNDYIMA